MIYLNHVSKTLKKKTILKNISLQLSEGRIYLIEGHNGCGKTMLLRMICGLIKPDQGSLFMDKEYSFGAVIENPSFIETDTVFENLEFLASINKKINENQINAWLKRLNLYDKRNCKVKTLSLGMKQRMAICQAVMENPDVVLLDEPFNALDKENLHEVIQVINQCKAENKIVVIAAHNVALKEKLKINQIFQMENGYIIDSKQENR